MDNIRNLYVYITFTTNNIFINCYRDLANGQREPIGFKQLSSDKLLVGKSKKNWESVADMAEKVADWIVKMQQNQITVIFKNFGTAFRRRAQTNYGIEKKRTIFIDAFSKAKLVINCLVDASAVPFNGCKTQKNRRKKKKHMIKPQKLVI